MAKWKTSELSGKCNPGSFALGGLNPPPRKGDTARLARYALNGAGRSYGAADAKLWHAIYFECSAYAAKFEQGALFDGEVAA